MKQVLSDAERSSIRRDINRKKMEHVQDPKISFFKNFVLNKTVLDLGCIDHDPLNSQGSYWLHGHMKHITKKLVGLDYYEQGVKYFEGSEFDIRYGDAQNFNFDEKFDVVTAGDLIEHLPNPGNFLECTYNNLNEQGILVLSTPNPWCWKYVVNFIFRKNSDRINREHVCWFCNTTIKLLLSRFGFEIIKLEYCSRRWWEKAIPLPGHIKNTTINIAAKKL